MGLLLLLLLSTLKAPARARISGTVTEAGATLDHALPLLAVVALDNAGIDTRGETTIEIPLGAYIDSDAGITCCVSSWRRVDDNMIPARAKVNGLYVNNSLAKTEAQTNGFDEAILLNQDGHVSEGSGENIVLIRRGKLITPPPADNVLEGITLETIGQVAKDLGYEFEARAIDRTELYIADEVFMTGTAAHVTPVLSVDRVPVGDGNPGPVTRQLQRAYFDAITGRTPRYTEWLTPIFKESAVRA